MVGALTRHFCAVYIHTYIIDLFQINFCCLNFFSLLKVIIVIIKVICSYYKKGENLNYSKSHHPDIVSDFYVPFLP